MRVKDDIITISAFPLSPFFTPSAALWVFSPHDVRGHLVNRRDILHRDRKYAAF